MEKLSKEESNIINLMTEGYRIKEIAAKYEKSLDKVNVIVARMMRRYGCRTSIQLVAKLFREEFL